MRVAFPDLALFAALAVALACAAGARPVAQSATAAGRAVRLDPDPALAVRFDQRVHLDADGRLVLSAARLGPGRGARRRRDDVTVEQNVAVLQPLPGIGDMIWHLPHIRAIAAHVGSPVTLIVKPRSAADQIVPRGAGRARRDVAGPQPGAAPRPARWRRFGLGRFVRDLRARRFDAIYLLHHSQTLAGATMAARIQARFGYGFRLQRLALNRPPFLSASVLRLCTTRTGDSLAGGGRHSAGRSGAVPGGRCAGR